MRIRHFALGLLGTNVYVAFDEESKHAIIVDPADCTRELVDFIEKEELIMDAVLLTHAHFDHIMGLKAFTKEYDVPVYIHEDDLPAMTNVRLNQSANYVRNGFVFDGCKALKDGDVLHLADRDIKVFHTPGHTLGGACYYIASENILFSGDTLFQNSVGRTDFENGSTSALIRSIREKLLVLPEDTFVLPGHMGTTTIGNEKNYNPFL